MQGHGGAHAASPAVHLGDLTEPALRGLRASRELRDGAPWRKRALRDGCRPTKPVKGGDKWYINSHKEGVSRLFDTHFLSHFRSFHVDLRQSLYILSRGLVAVNHRIGFDGAVWGEDFVLSDVSLIKPVQCYALTYIEAQMGRAYTSGPS